mmetsp:Transcript_41194/g.95031  ORF Transcript_41194/g.95031 Transcript_41194/m.95031 type:complete len:223 (-) Transcript_41194:413-1081(-)
MRRLRCPVTAREHARIGRHRRRPSSPLIRARAAAAAAAAVVAAPPPVAAPATVAIPLVLTLLLISVVQCRCCARLGWLLNRHRSQRGEAVLGPGQRHRLFCVPPLQALVPTLRRRPSLDRRNAVRGRTVGAVFTWAPSIPSVRRPRGPALLVFQTARQGFAREEDEHGAPQAHSDAHLLHGRPDRRVGSRRELRGLVRRTLRGGGCGGGGEVLGLVWPSVPV